jgi:hypothetical protein
VLTDIHLLVIIYYLQMTTIIIHGSLISTGPNSFNGDFNGQTDPGTLTPAVPSWSVPDATLEYQTSDKETSIIVTIKIPFSGTIGPTSVDLHSTSPSYNAEITGQLVSPIDKQYDVTGTITINIAKPSSYSTISVYIAFY